MVYGLAKETTMIELRAIYILWLREMKKLRRSKERIIGSVAMPLIFLAFLGASFSGTPLKGLEHVSYIDFLVPGILGMNMLFSSMFAGISVLWDREFGFLKEIMVAPVSRVSIALGRIAGGATTGLIQGAIMFVISFAFGFRLDVGSHNVGALREAPVLVLAILLMFVFMVLIALTFLSLGLAFASNMRDAQGFELIINFVMFPLFFLSGAVSPISNLPSWLMPVVFANPLTYGVDGIRAALTNYSIFSVSYDLMICTIAAIIMVSIAAFFFERSEGV